jgi:Tfp pilus assembly protein PilF
MRFTVFGVVACLFLSGCAGWRQQIAAPQPTVADQREVRRDAAVQSFEQHRDAMQLQAALDRFEQGDYAGCESHLAALVERRPDFVPARLRLAEILWSRGDAAAAEQHYQAVLAIDAGHSEALHGLGTLLEAEGRFDEAAVHLARANDLAAEPTDSPQMDADERR